MLREVSTVTVFPHQEEQTISAYQAFGWTLTARRRVPDGEKAPGVKLTFERERMGKSRKLLELERSFHALREPKKPIYYRKIRILSSVSVLLAAFGLLVFFFTRSTEVLLAAGLGGGILLGICEVGKAKCRFWDAACRRNREERETILHQAAALREKEAERLPLEIYK